MMCFIHFYRLKIKRTELNSIFSLINPFIRNISIRMLLSGSAEVTSEVSNKYLLLLRREV